ncbi:hypothetical protein AKJ52_00695 [candidate division MSBL1 archaeon SCGC-AAA382C18]|uniref:Uncharacterized protein n=1 Tax=candidate division MSBL1 archaeon SCGC-AAA382C18 TaxID=1698281 RepID=A0A133VLB7_9EURY|nr:hypothetical protein AKJ52_00695 [candidate division MSBL1 archaeon SCGC-AAA382C18]
MSEDEKKNLEPYLTKIAKGAGIIFAGSLIGRAVGFLTRVIIARGLGPSAYGVISIGFALISVFVMIPLLGFTHGGIVRFISMYKGKEDKRAIKGTIHSSFRLPIPLSIGVGLILFFLSGWISHNLFSEPALIPVLKVFGIGLPILVVLRILINLLAGFQRMDYKVYSRKITQYFSRTALVYISVSLGLGVFAVAISYVIATIFAALVAFYFIQKKVFPIVGDDIEPKSLTRKLILYSWPLLLTGYLGFVNGWVDRLLLGYFMTSTDVGFYNAAYPTAKLLTFATTPFASIFVPVLSEMYGKNLKGSMEKIYQTVTKWVLMLLIPGVVFLFLFPNGVLKVLYGTEYTVASTSLRILAFGIFLSPTILFFTSRGTLKTVGKTKIVMLTTLITAGLNVFLNYFLIPLYGIEGAAYATSLSFVCGGVFAGFMTVKKTGFFPFAWKETSLIVLSGLSSALSVFFISTWIDGGIIILALYGVTIALVHFSLIAILGVFDENDLAILSALERKIGFKLGFIRKIMEKSL